ncbi:DUF6443 domain-containing protein [Chitinophaga ginsengisoli]|nr:DUF6443 domain-containing protein [Chitinophaga ginsengisoli]
MKHPRILKRNIAKKLAGLYFILILLLGIITADRSSAQTSCTTTTGVIGDLYGFHLSSSETDGANNYFWFTTSAGAIQGANTNRDVTIKWVATGTANVQVTYNNRQGAQVVKCWVVTIYPKFQPGTITSSVTTAIYNEVFSYTNLVNSTAASGGITQGTSGPYYTYQWEKSTDNVNWTKIAGATDLNCTGSDIMTVKQYFRRSVNGVGFGVSNVIAVDIVQPFKAGRISSSQKISAGTTPAQLLAATAPSGGNGTYTYQWESSVDDNVWNAISGATGASYQPGGLSRTTYFRRKVMSGIQWLYSNTLQIMVDNGSGLNTPANNTSSTTAVKQSIPAYSGLNPDALATVSSYSISRPGVSSASQISGLDATKDYSKEIVYLDGLSRPVQSIYYKNSYNGKDVAAIDVYDEYGREQVHHLPYIAPTDASNGGKFRTDAAIQQPQYYNTLTGNQDDYYYTVDLLEESPVARKRKSIPAGKSFAGNNSGTSGQFRVNYDYDNVRIWTVGDNAGDMPSSTAIYSSGTLAVSVRTYAHHNKEYQFTDKSGKVVMTSVMNDADNEGEGLRTYYVYDDLGNLRYIIPPLAVKYCSSSNNWDFAVSTVSSNILKELCFKYVYDEKGRVVAKEIPGVNGPVYLVYDVRNRLVFAQDIGLRNRGLGEWYLYFYDGLDRPVMTALYKNPTATKESLQTMMNTITGASMVTSPLAADLIIDGSTPFASNYVATNSITFLPEYTSPDNAGFTAEIVPAGTGIIVNNPSANITGYEALQITYYDNYDWSGAKTFNTSYLLDAGTNPNPVAVSPAKNSLGRLTGTRTKVLGTDQWLSHTIYYDDHGRIIQVADDNISGGTDVATRQYDFSGKTLSTYLSHKNPKSAANPEIQLQRRYEYTSNGWLSRIYQTILNSSNAQPKLLSEFTYDEAGRIKTSTLGALETMNYDYTLHGQLKGINAEYARNKSTNHYFGMELFYENGFSAPRLDGNTSGVTWRRKGDPDEWHAYGYTFDNVSRLTKADYTQNTSGNWTNDVADYKVSVPQYDENGNIKTMKQDGMLAGSVKTGVDDLTYFNKNSEYSNQLSGVTDVQGDKKQGDFKNYSGRTGTEDYSYDLSGNLIKDKNRGISIAYNYLVNKPEKITFDNDPNKSITYVYNAGGDKLQRIIKDGTSTITYDYVSGFIYKNNILMLFPTPNGRVRRNASGDFVYDYFIADHLGNTRTVITEETNEIYYKATHEDNPQPAPAIPERDLFTFPKNVDNIPTTNKFYDYNGTNRKFIKLNNNDPDRRIGTAKVLKVMAGDVVNMGVMSYYPVNSAANNVNNQPVNLILDQLINLILGPVSVFPNGKGNIVQSNSNGLLLNRDDFSNYLTSTQNDNPTSTVPKAYLNYVLFDEKFKMVAGGAVRVSTPDVVAPLTANLNVNKNGFLYIYVSNESPSDVYFDDLSIRHTTGHLLQEDSYYPFGLQIRSLSSMALNRLQNDYLYNGIEKISEFDLEIYDALYRNSDPQIGRWMQVDPRAESYFGISPYNSNFNNPVGFTDPLGDEPPGDDPPAWLKLLWPNARYENGIITLSEVTVKGTSPFLRVVSDFSVHFVTNDYYGIAMKYLKARSTRTDRPSRDNLVPADIRPLPTSAPKAIPKPDITVTEPKQTFIQADDDYYCEPCKEEGRRIASEREYNRRLFETEQGGNYLVVKTAVEAAAWEFAMHKVIQGATYLGIGFLGGDFFAEYLGGSFRGNGVHVAEGALEYTMEEAAMAREFGLYPETISIKDGVANLPIGWMDRMKPAAVRMLKEMLKRNGAKYAMIDSGPIIRDDIIQSYEYMRQFKGEIYGLKIYKVNDYTYVFFGEL